ncbi:23S rRNA (uracil(1939)-C(5))-methyltransferase RlmD [Candidatus Woesearchaeota archaeon]|nr:MAG: 23S rRNA (uracil(1939)-C(5))-methyltransferase RlmD [Candidatus Woesearchaeota archaeon]
MVRIEQLNSKAEGVAGNMKILYALPGEEVESKRFGKIRRPTNILKPSKHRVEPFCRHFGTCGGCALQHLEYAEQVKWKASKLSTLFERPVEVIPSPKTTHYRNRMDYVMHRNSIGLRERGSWKFVVDIEECPIFAQEHILKKHSSFLHSLPSFDLVKKEGVFKYVVIRGSGDDFAMIFCCTSKGREYIHAILEALTDVPNIALTFNDGVGDISMGEELEVIKGNEYYIEHIGEYVFKVPLNGFVQPNPFQAKLLYDHIKSLVDSDEVVDLFCGMGSIGIYCSPKKLFGIEVVPQAVNYAQENARAYGVNAHFECVDLYTSPTLPGEDPLVIVDPPREGLGKRTIKLLCEQKPRKIIYVSCNPHSCKQDLEKMAEFYTLRSIKGFDMFPHTPHVEVVVELTSKQGI